MQASRRILGVAFLVARRTFATSCSGDNVCEYPDDN